MDEIIEYKRKSYLEVGEIYFWTATINKWQGLLTEDKYKDVVINSLQYLSEKGIIDVFAFIVMPNHIHLICRINKKNGKETPQASFLKYTAHQFKKTLRDDKQSSLYNYQVNTANKDFEFWQRDSLAIHLYNKEVAIQKLEYIHNNPLADHWNLVIDSSEYKYSSAKYYEQNKKDFEFLKDLWEEF